MTTQLSARNVTQKLMNNEMRRGYSKLTQKIKVMQKKVFLTKNTLYIHTHSHRYKTQTAVVKHTN